MSFFKETQRSTFTLSWIAQATLFGPLIILFLIVVLLPSLVCLDLLFGSIEVATMLPMQQQSLQYSPSCLVFSIRVIFPPSLLDACMEDAPLCFDII